MLGAGRQTGQISLWSQHGWSVKTTPDANVLRMDEPSQKLPTESRGAVKYRFVKQPFSLKLDIQPQATKTTVETVHVARVTANSVRLLSTLQFRVRGPRPEFIDVDAADWQLISADPHDEVALESPAETGKPWRLKLQPGHATRVSSSTRMAQGSSREWQFKLRIASLLGRTAVSRLALRGACGERQSGTATRIHAIFGSDEKP